MLLRVQSIQAIVLLWLDINKFIDFSITDSHRQNFNLGLTVNFNFVINHIRNFIFLIILSQLLLVTDSHRFKLNIYLLIFGIRLMGILSSILKFLFLNAYMVFHSFIRARTHTILDYPVLYLGKYL